MTDQGKTAEQIIFELETELLRLRDYGRAIMLMAEGMHPHHQEDAEAFARLGELVERLAIDINARRAIAWNKLRERETTMAAT